MHFDDTYDVVIVGAGPAGLSFARTILNANLRKRLLIIEKAKYPRDKACGDGLTHASVALLNTLFPEVGGGLPTKSHTRRYTVLYPNGKAIHRSDAHLDLIPRKTLDTALWNSIRHESIDTWEESYVNDLLWADDRVVGLAVTQRGSVRTVGSDLLIGADGSNSMVRRKTVGVTDDNVMVAVRQYVKGVPHCEDGFVMVLDPANVGYFWFFPFFQDGEWWANVGYGSAGTNPLKRFKEYCRNEVVQRYLGDGVFQSAPKGLPLNLFHTQHLSRLRLHKNLWGKGFLLVGDAAGLIHPHTGEGISAALYSGKLAAECYIAQNDCAASGPAYQKQLLEFLQPSYALLPSALLFRVPCVLPGFLRDRYMEWFPPQFSERDTTWLRRSARRARRTLRPLKQATKKHVLRSLGIWRRAKTRAYLARNLRRSDLVVFPRDDFPHEAQVEWWYFNAHLEDAGGHEYSVVGTILNSGHSYLALLDKGRRRFSVDAARGRFDPGTIGNGTMSWTNVGGFTYRVDSKRPRAVLRLSSNKKPLLVNDIGLGGTDSGYSYYASLTNCSAEGEIDVNGRMTSMKGRGWIDRQWGEMNLGVGVEWWEWFGIQLDNDVELMVYWIKERSGKEKRALHIVSDRTVVQDCEIRTLEQWTVNGRTWGSRWRIGSKDVDIECSLSVKEQFVNESCLEASGEALGTVDRQGVRGTVFAEKLYFTRVP